MKKILFLSGFIGIVLLSGCSTAKLSPKSEAYKGFYDEKPVAILIMPPINKTTNVEAKEFFHTTLNIPLSNAGYYVIPPFLSMEILKKESAYDAELFFNAPLTKFGEVFGADLALFTVINKWEKASVLATITVEVEYIIKSVHTNETLYRRTGNITVNANTNYGQSGYAALIGMVASAIQTAVTDHAIVGVVCNNVTLQDLPAGPYSPLNGKDGSQLAGRKNFKVSVNGSAKQIAKETAKWYSRYTESR
ncbi:MAG: DUF799 domain-containing protein [Dysgonamonadaceae bacterium]|jgi:hypothetical protein|nr:DUF799 domain-containing protein [Dysgonamonadaceae bacterium]